MLPDQLCWTDRRPLDVRHNQYAYKAPPVTDRAAWETRAAWVRMRVQLSAGLLPLPERTPLRPKVWGEFEHEGCRISKAQFESRPGFLVTGNVYQPLERKGRRPVVLCPHGHWAEGRVAETDRGSVPARCIALARLGFVVFAYDMVGYNDSRQVVHRWPPEMLQRASLWGFGPLGLQLWNSLRAVDFVAGLADVDPERIGCTGASGGASQTWNAAVLDERIKVVAPVCMLSSHYQGGCVCEESPLLRLGDLTTLDIAGALAPRPAFYPAVTGDWTNMNPNFEYPTLRTIYRLYDAEDRVGHAYFEAGHNYDHRTAEHVYAWMVKWLAGDKSVGKRIRQPQAKRPPLERMLIYPNDKPGPVSVDSKPALDRLIRAEARPFRKPPSSRSALRRFAKTYRETYAEVLGAGVGPGEVAVRVTYQNEEHDGFRVHGRVLSRRGVGDVVPALWIVPDDARKRAPATLVVHGKGKAALFKSSKPDVLLASLLKAGQRVLAIDAIGVGDSADALSRSIRELDDPVFYAFNPSLLALRVQDVLTALAGLRDYERPKSIRLCGIGEGARWALLALPLAGKVGAAALDLTGVDISDEDWKGESYHPLILKAGGLKTAISLAAPTPVMLAGAGGKLASWARAIYRSLGKPERLRTGRPSGKAMAKWCAEA